MNDAKEETIDDIEAEMRSHESGSAESAWYTREKWRNLCDRIHAAVARERASRDGGMK